MIGVGIKRQRVGECRPAVSLLLRRKGEEQELTSAKALEGSADAATASIALGEDASSGIGTAGGEGGDVDSSSGGLSLLAGYGSEEAEDE